MKFDDLLNACRGRAAQHVAIGLDGRAYSGRDPIALTTLELLGDSLACGFERPVVDPGRVTILDGSEDPQPAYQLSPREARWFAAELLRAADEAEELDLLPTQERRDAV